MKKSMLVALIAALSLSGCASSQAVRASDDFRFDLVYLWGIPEDRIVTTWVDDDGTVGASLLLEADTCPVEVERYDDDYPRVGVKILRVGEWTPPGNHLLSRSEYGGDRQLHELCKEHAPTH